VPLVVPSLHEFALDRSQIFLVSNILQQRHWRGKIVSMNLLPGDEVAVPKPVFIGDTPKAVMFHQELVVGARRHKEVFVAKD
jgi:hypothetical protein